MQEQLLCGAARVKITPDLSLLPELRGLKDQRFGGVLDDIFVRVIALEDNGVQALLVSFDLDKVPSPDRLIRRLTQETGIKEELITMTAVHTHTAPIAGARPDEGPNDLTQKPQSVQRAARSYEDDLEAALVLAVKTAVDHKVPCRLGIGMGNSYINVDRRQWYAIKQPDGRIKYKCALGVDPSSPVDRTVTVLRFEDYQGEALAYFINYPVHCCILHTNRLCQNKLGISGDIAGFVSAGLESREEGCTAIWTSGAAGDINPVIQLEMYYPNAATGDMEVHTLDANGYDLLRVVGSRHLADVYGIIQRIKCDQTCARLCGAVAWSETPGKVPDTQYKVRLHMLRLGDIVLFGASGELYASYARWLKNVLPGDRLIVMNHEASLFAPSGYIFDDETLLLPEADLPGLDHTNMKAGYFISSLTEHVLSMYSKCMYKKERRI